MTELLTEILNEYNDAEKCKIRDPAKVEQILQGLINDGSSKLQVITDFDFTLTRFHKDGTRCTSAHGVVDDSPLMPDIYREKAKALLSKYYPIEIDHEMSTEEKIPHMITWYKKSHDLLIEFQVTRDKIQEMVQTGNAVMRDSAKDVLSLLNDHNVPCLIFSAGLGNILEEVLHRENAYFSNVKVVSNFMQFNELGECTTFKDPLIHMFNKNESALDNPNYFEELINRNNALVLGDSLGDMQMDTGLCNPGSILKIGFLNDKINERLESFVNSFDVVLIDDQSFKFVEIVLKKILLLQRNAPGSAVAN